MRSFWLAGVATASSLSSAAGGMSAPLTAASASAGASATAICVQRALGNTLPRTRHVGSRRSRSSTATPTRATAFVMPPPSFSTTTKTSTWVSTAATRGRQQQQQQHASTSALAMTTTTTMAAEARRPLVAAFSSFSGSWVTTEGQKSGAGAVVGVGSRRSFQDRHMMMSSETAAAAAVEGGDNSAPAPPPLADQGGQDEEEQEGPAPLKVGVDNTHRFRTATCNNRRVIPAVRVRCTRLLLYSSSRRTALSPLSLATVHVLLCITFSFIIARDQFEQEQRGKAAPGELLLLCIWCFPCMYVVVTRGREVSMRPQRFVSGVINQVLRE